MVPIAGNSSTTEPASFSPRHVRFAPVPHDRQQEASDQDDTSDFDAFLTEVDAAAVADKVKDTKKSTKKNTKKDLHPLEVELFGSDYDYDEDSDGLSAHSGGSTT